MRGLNVIKKLKCWIETRQMSKANEVLKDNQAGEANDSSVVGLQRHKLSL
jgi:hypothetical protein